MKHYDKVWTEIDLDAVLNNLEKVKKSVNDDTQIICVVKSDAYGHGAIHISKTLESDVRVWGFAVSRSEEAFALREKGITKDILIMGYTFPYCFEQLINNDITVSISLMDSAIMLSDCAAKLNKKCKVQIRINSELNDGGIQPDENGIELIKKIMSLPGLAIEGIYGQLSSSYDFDRDTINRQLDIFKKFTMEVENKLKISFKLKHCSNSASILAICDRSLNCVRTGSFLYGLCPSKKIDFNSDDVIPALSLKARVIYVKVIPRNQKIGNEGSFTTFRDTHVATVCIGYGDGYPRNLSNAGIVLVNGQKAHIIGNICMDQIMVDVTDIDGEVCVGDIVTLIGNDSGSKITVDELCDLSERFSYEMVCDIGKRIPRIYKIDDTLISE